MHAADSFVACSGCAYALETRARFGTGSCHSSFGTKASVARPSSSAASLAQPDRLSGRALPAPVRGDELAKALVTATATATAVQVLPPSVAASEETPKPTVPSLNLTLSRESLKSLVPSAAATSPFQGKVPISAERRIADAAAETGPWTEERIDMDHVRLRRGTTCVILSRPQVAKIDPFSDASKRVPWGASQPSECR